MAGDARLDTLEREHGTLKGEQQTITGAMRELTLEVAGLRKLVEALTVMVQGQQKDNERCITMGRHTVTATKDVAILFLERFLEWRVLLGVAVLVAVLMGSGVTVYDMISVAERGVSPASAGERGD